MAINERITIRAHFSPTFIYFVSKAAMSDDYISFILRFIFKIEKPAKGETDNAAVAKAVCWINFLLDDINLFVFD